MTRREEIMLIALRRAKFIMESPLIADWVNGAGALDAVNAAIILAENPEYEFDPVMSKLADILIASRKRA